MVLPNVVLSSGLTDLFTGLSGVMLINAAIVVSAAIIADKASNFLIRRAVKKRGGDRHAATTANKISSYVIYSVGFMVLLGVFGVPASSIGTVLGLLGLGLSFALRDMIANFISGLMILINHPFKIGDQIEVDGREGTVKDIRMRATFIKTYDGREMVVPNSKLYNSTVINNTSYDERRFEVLVGVSYEDDVPRAMEISEDVLSEVESVSDSQEPKVLVDEFADSSVVLRLWGWTSSQRADQLETASEVKTALKKRFDEEGIEIPFPIRTVEMETRED